MGPAVDRLIDGLVDSAEAALPRVVTAAVVFIVALVAITVATRLLGWALDRVSPPEDRLVVDLIVVVVAAVLWFVVGLALLSVLGLDEVAAGMGTAVGFAALGVSYALSEMIEDTVAGVYLLRDPDFAPGDRVETEAVSGTVASIGLRKSRFVTDDGDLAVVANREVERRWTRHRDEPAG